MYYQKIYSENTSAKWKWRRAAEAKLGVSSFTKPELPFRYYSCYCFSVQLGFYDYFVCIILHNYLTFPPYKNVVLDFEPALCRGPFADVLPLVPVPSKDLVSLAESPSFRYIPQAIRGGSSFLSFPTLLFSRISNQEITLGHFRVKH